MKKLFFSLLLGAALLTIVLLLEYYTNWDLFIQEYFFDRDNHRWKIYPALHKELTVFFYNGLKNLIVLTAVICLGWLLASIHYKELRTSDKPFWIMLLSIIFVPTIVAGAKYITNVYCPYQLDIYNGLYPFIRIIENYPADYIQPKPGRCFPAGHATAGFAFMALYYCFKTSWKRWTGLTLGLALGWTAALYQMYRGQHFLSHSFFSMIASFMVIMIVNYVLTYLLNRFEIKKFRPKKEKLLIS